MSTILKNFIVFEGLDGSGTTTQMQLLAETCDRSSRLCKATFEPTDKPIGRLVRSILQKQVVTTPLALALLYAADREDHLFNPIYGIAAEAEAGRLVISDRYLYSSLAYQSVECGYETIVALNRFPHPEYLFFLDTPVEECLRRIAHRKTESELFEQHEFLIRVKANYERIFADLDPGVKFTRIDGLLSIEEISAIIRNTIFNG
ncbi:MAG: dTMP kinase [Spirochaetales bacterium]|nr:dTMP kinase [Spirochaetales bacterium]